jgi:hypothetical protein
MRSHVKIFKNFEKNPKYSNYLKKNLLFIATNYLLKNPKLQVFWLVFAILNAFFVKIDFFSTRFKFFLTNFSSNE